MKVMIIPEDFRKDQYILKPLFSRLFKRLGASPLEVYVCQDPLLGGTGEALKTEQLATIVEDQKGMMDIFILCVDRDGQEGRRRRLDQIEAEFQGNCVFFAENAWEEIETWVLAGLTLPSDWRWVDVRREVQVKEVYFDILAQQRGVAGGRDGGRRVLGEEASRRIRAIRQKCPEDFESLARRLETAVQAT